MLSAQRTNRAVGAVIYQRDDARAVTQEWASARDGVEDAVEAQPRRHGGWVLLQTLRQAPCATDGQGRQVADASAVAEVVGPATAGEGRMVNRGGFLEGQVVERILVEAGERV